MATYPRVWRTVLEKMEGINSAQQHFDDAAAVSHAVPRLRLRGAEVTQLADVADADLAPLVHVTSRGAVQIDAHLVGALVMNAGHPAGAQPVGTEFLHQRHGIERGRARELVRFEHLRIAGCAPTVRTAPRRVGYGRRRRRWGRRLAHDGARRRNDSG